MSGLQKLKAYFGMVPAEDMDSYDDGYADDYAPESGQYDGYEDRVEPRRRYASPRADFRAEQSDRDYAEVPARRSWADSAPVRGALAVEPQREVTPRLRPVADKSGGAKDMSRITTLKPSSFSDALTIGEHFRDGTPVIINLTDMDDADAKRLVDFSAGLAFAVRGDIDKITSKVFLLSPPNVDVTAEDKKKLAQGGFFSHN